MEEKDIYKVPAEEHGQGPVRLFSKKPNCVVCVTVGRGVIKEGFKRKPFMELLVNTI